MNEYKWKSSIQKLINQILREATSCVMKGLRPDYVLKIHGSQKRQFCDKLILQTGICPGLHPAQKKKRLASQICRILRNALLCRPPPKKNS